MKPSIPQGTRDFNAETLRKRNFIFNTVKEVFELYGFQPLETPAMENLETLMGKYGDEGDKLIFRILESGNPFSKIFFQELQKFFKEGHDDYLEIKQIDNTFPEKNPYDLPFYEFNTELLEDISTQLIKHKENLALLKNKVSEKALRYDLTIPFARYVAMNYGQLNFPFKRYQIQPVWRADRPQRGRYREFYQCDADIVGSNSLLNEVEFANIYATAFERLKIDVAIKINNRKILAALAEMCGGSDRMTDITIAIDKLDKIGLEKVKQELASRNLSEQQISFIEKYLLIDGGNSEKISQIKSLIGETEIGKKGIEELEYVLDYMSEVRSQKSEEKSQTSNISHLTSNIVVDFTLARGLNYYTGTIFEVKANNIQIGSIGGGGRYDDLTGLFGVANTPGVGISFGVDRIYDVMQELNLFPENVHTGTKVLFFNLGETEAKVAFGLMQQLRDKNISCEIYPEKVKLDKQFKYAERKNILYTIIIGSKEVENKTCTIKNIKTGEQKEIQQRDILSFQYI